MSEFAAVLNVTSLAGGNGFRIDGDLTKDYSGGTVAGDCDVNGDGYADLLIGAPLADTGGTNTGAAFLVFGAASTPATGDLAARIAAGTAYRFQGEGAGDLAGYSARSAGDVNGDGFGDFIIGAHNADPDSPAGNRGAAYLVFGGTVNLEALDTAGGSANDNRINLGNLTAARGYRLDGDHDGYIAGFSVSGAGDVNGDGFDDIMVGEHYANPLTGYGYYAGHEGRAFIIFGGSANMAALDGEDTLIDGRIDLGKTWGGQGIVIDGPQPPFPPSVAFLAGRSVAMVGDVNGDGFDDAMLGAEYAGAVYQGKAYLVFGRGPAQVPLSSLKVDLFDGVQGTQFLGTAGSNLTGRQVNAAGDLNADGFADMVIGAPFADPGGLKDAGSIYVVFGKSAWGALNDLGALDGSDGFRIDGLRAGDSAGFFVTTAGDVNGDGYDDLLLGMNKFDRLGAADAGAAFVIFGKASGFAPTLDLGSLNGDTGFRIDGALAGHELGFGSLGPAGDVNGDGFADIAVAARTADNGAVDSGSTYVIYGHRAETDVVRTGTGIANSINGGKGDDTISGLGGGDTLRGWEGDDTMSGGGGIDVIDGGTGNDAISAGSQRDVIIASAGEDDIDGGSERDLWDFSGFGAQAITLDLTTGVFAHPNLEDVQTFASIEDVTGTSGADTISGGGARNTFKGGAGADTLSGGGGADLITGGAGADTMTGGNGPDRFIYAALGDSGLAVAARDTITDFTVDPAVTTAFIDKIDVSAIDAKAGTALNNGFTFIGAAAFSAEGQIRAAASGGSDTLLEFNTSGTAGAEMRILLLNILPASLSEFDFAL